MRTIARHLCLVVVLTIGPIATARAQEARPYRYTLEGYLSEMSLASDVSSRTGLGGFGVRAMFNRSDVARAARTVFDRASAGAFWTYAKKDGATFHHVGGEVDAVIVKRPVAGLFEPFLGLGVGVFRSSTPSSVAGAKLASSDFALTPGAGVRIPLVSTFGARGDLRLPIVFGSSTNANVVAEGGLYLRF
jgi:hypothetical protein